MANIKFSDLTAVGSVAGTDILAVASSGTSKKATVTQLSTFLLGQSPVTITDGLALSNIILPAQITGNLDNWNPTGLATAFVIYATSDASHDITGLQAQQAGRIIVIKNGGATQNIVLKQFNAGSLTANKFSLTGLADVTLTPGKAAVLYYNGSVWLQIAGC